MQQTCTTPSRVELQKREYLNEDFYQIKHRTLNSTISANFHTFILDLPRFYAKSTYVCGSATLMRGKGERVHVRSSMCYAGNSLLYQSKAMLENSCMRLVTENQYRISAVQRFLNQYNLAAFSTSNHPRHHQKNHLCLP